MRENAVQRDCTQFKVIKAKIADYYPESYIVVIQRYQSTAQRFKCSNLAYFLTSIHLANCSVQLGCLSNCLFLNLSEIVRCRQKKILHRFYFSAACGENETGEQKVMSIMIKNGQVIPLTGPLTTQIHLRSVCFDSKAAGTKMNVFLLYDSISRASVIFPLWPLWFSMDWSAQGPTAFYPERAFPTGGHVWMTPWYAGGARPRR